ncbi:MAG: sugar phosphate isomerase/epimerase [Planctomycetes bacterium]|nr:sugar phosphate isomerase/epimerase [Planctomycetota bacterium]
MGTHHCKTRAFSVPARLDVFTAQAQHVAVLRLSYNTNGFAHHRLEDAIEILRELGYEGIGLTLDVHHLDPFRTGATEIAEWRRRLSGLEIVIQTGARYLLDPRRKHEPTLLSKEADERMLRIRFLERAIDVASELGATAVSFWSGSAPAGAAPSENENRLLEGCARICKKAETSGILLAFEPEPGMWIERFDQYQTIRKQLNHRQFGLGLDVGHLDVTGESLEPILQNHLDEIFVTQIEDIAGRRHEHRMFGEGELDFSAILGLFRKYNYRRLLECELSRDSHRAPACARAAIEFLRRHGA